MYKNRIDFSDLPPTKSISVHRAFIYGAGAPGLGEFYAGARLRGLATAALFISFSIWFGRILYVMAGRVVGGVFESLDRLAPLALPEMPLLSLGVSFLVVYATWLWAMMSAVDTAAAYRRHNGQNPQTSVAWATAMAWFCPGCGQIYVGSRRYGYLLLGAYVLGIVAMIPAYMHLFDGISGLARSGQLSPGNPYAVIDAVHGLMARVANSLGKLYWDGIRYVAIADTLGALGQRFPADDTRWSKPSPGFGAALFGLGWLCPGSGQLLQKRSRTGWLFLAAFIGSKFLIGFLLGRDLITVGSADMMGWLPVLIQWGAMVESPLWTIRKEWKNSKVTGKMNRY